MPMLPATLAANPSTNSGKTPGDSTPAANSSNGNGNVTDKEQNNDGGKKAAILAVPPSLPTLPGGLSIPVGPPLPKAKAPASTSPLVYKPDPSKSKNEQAIDETTHNMYVATQAYNSAMQALQLALQHKQMVDGYAKQVNKEAAMPNQTEEQVS